MSSSKLREVIQRAMHGSLITGLALSACSDGTASSSKDAGLAQGGQDAGSGQGGHAAVGGGRGGQLAANCYDNGIGICCRDDVCFAPPTAHGGAGSSASDRDAGDTEDAGQTPAACPSRWPSQGACTNFSNLTGTENGQCCYVRTQGTCCGRPLLDGEQMLLASVRSRLDWLEQARPLQSTLDAATQAALASAWLRDARLEHASIASFARFGMQLLALGAPGDLVAAAQQAALDEVAHAQLCFGLASRYAGCALGPGELPLPGTLEVQSLATAAAAAVIEGCVAETLAAHEALAQLEAASDAQVREALARIAGDESRHAAIAYRFVRWAIALGGDAVADAVRSAFERARPLTAAAPEPAEELDETAWHAHGRLTERERTACALRGWRDVIEPCARGLFEGAALS